MSKILFCLILSAVLISAQSTEKQFNYVPGEIIIKYEITGTTPRGSEIIEEHNNIVSKIISILPEIKPSVFSPVFQSVVDEMVSKNVTEEQLHEVKQIIKSSKNILSAGERIKFSTALLLNTKNIDENIEELVNKINNNPHLFLNKGFRVVYAEPNYLKVTNTQDVDPLYSEQWSHQITKIDQAWAITKGNASIKIAIIDSGVDPTHPDLAGNLLNDGYDFVDIDLSKYSNFTKFPGEDYTGLDADYSDYNGHGTHCAGIASAIGDNGIGVKGVAPECKILPLRAGFTMESQGVQNVFLETVAIVNAINYAVEHGANIISMSFGGSHSELEQEAIKYAYQQNIVLIAAAGNSNSLIKAYPAAYKEVIAVTSISSSKYKSSFSNFGYWTDIAAPGDSIISTVPLIGGNNTNSLGYMKLSGTSMAAPYIAGVAALILSQNPAINNDLVYQTLLTGVDPYRKTNDDTFNNTDKYIGSGIVNVYKALSNEESCIAKISWPTVLDNFFCKDELDISGKAFGNNFNKYFFEYKDYLDEKSSWKTLSSYYNTSVDSGLLGKMIMPEDGIYHIRLKVINNNNQEFTDIIGPVTVDRRLKENWPISTGGYESVSSPALSDIDKDGTIETIFTNSQGGIYVLEPDGSNKPGWPVFLTNVHGVQGIVGYSSPAIADIDNDGKEEIIVKDGQQLFVYDYQGNLKPGWPREMSWIMYGNAMVSSPVVADINNDNKKEIIVTFRGDNSEDGKILVMNSHGDNLVGWPLTIPSKFTNISSPIVCDLDGDGNVEIVIQCYDNMNLGYIYILDKFGEVLPGWPQQFGGGAWNSPVVADINNDGEYEIIACSHAGIINSQGKIGVYVFSKQGNVLNGWPALLDYAQYGYYNIEPGISVGDINNDGNKEILIASEGYSYSLWALNKNGQLLWNVLSKDFEFVKNSSPLIADINGDGKPEIIITKLNNLSNYGKVMVIDNNGNEISSLSRYIPDRIRATPSIGDIDGDNKLELVCISQSGKAYCWDYDAPYDPGKLIWPTYQQNNLRNGILFIKPEAPSIIELVEPVDKSKNLQTKTIFTWNPVDGALKYYLQLSDDEYFNNILYEDNTITEVNYELGSLENGKKYYWRVRGINNYGNGEWSEIREFTTIVAAPEKVELVYPSNRLDKTPISVDLKWTKSLLAEKYWIQISTDDGFSKIVLNDTTITDTVKNIDNLENNTTYYWRIKAKNIGGTSLWSSVWMFTTIVPIPGAPVLAVPVNNAKEIDIDFQLRWRGSQYSNAYNLYLAMDKEFLNITLFDSTLTDTLKEVKGMKEGIKYYWKVNSKNVAGEGVFSDVWNFTTHLNEPDSLVANELEKGKIKLTWKDKSENETGFKIERKLTDQFVLLDSVYANITSYIDTTTSQTGVYNYRIYAYTSDASSKFTNETIPIFVDVSEFNTIPTEYALFQNYPNPFNPETKIKYQLPKSDNVKLILYDILGKVIKVLDEGYKYAGYFEIDFDGSTFSSGIYIYSLISSECVLTKKMLLLK